jgi:hypothetical protein
MSDVVVIVSPHLDDAVLSAASQLLRPGARVVTVCAGEPPAGTPLAYWDRLTGADDPSNGCATATSRTPRHWPSSVSGAPTG